MLSLPPPQSTIAFAENFLDNIKNPPKPPHTLTWKDILAEEPFEGQHWEGAYNLPPGSTVEDWDTHSGGSTPSLSPLDDSDDLGDSLSSFDSEEPMEVIPPLIKTVGNPQRGQQSYSHRREFDKLQARQYWKSDWRVDAALLNKPFNIGDASTLGMKNI